MKECPFCNNKFEGRKYYEDEHCIAVLASPDIRGYSLVILKKHYRDISDIWIPDSEMIALIKTVNFISFKLKDLLKAERIYVASLCDGVEHLHFHLIPRYKWERKDFDRYKELFTERDGIESVDRQISVSVIGGFWYLADIERWPRCEDTPEYYEKMLEILA